MNRNDEFLELKQELEQTPIELGYTAKKAILKLKKTRRRSLLWKTPLVSFCSIAITFVILVNLFPAVALAMSNIPFLENLVSAVAFDPSLKLAVENDYVQIIGESQTQEDVTVTVEYMILDAGHISLFFRVDSPVNKGLYHYDFTDSGKKPFPASIVFDTMYEVGKLEELKIDFVDGSDIPDDINFKVTINKDEQFQESVIVEVPAPTESDASFEPIEPENTGTDYEFTFVLYPDEEFSQTVNSHPINQWIEIKGQKIYLKSLDIYPSQARLYFLFDENNSALVDELNIYFEDNMGAIYDTKKNGISGTGTADSFDIGSIYFESSYFAGADQLKLYIDGISIIEKDQLYGEVNFSQKTITNLPGGVTIDTMELKDSTLLIRLKVTSDKPNNLSEIISSIYYDLDGNEINFGSWSTGTDNEFTYISEYKIANYEDNKYKIRWAYSPQQLLEEPIILDIK
ncbi:MAG: DUF4179 domain-containing protein [Mobilitalea sp.]